MSLWHQVAAFQWLTGWPQENLMDPMHGLTVAVQTSHSQSFSRRCLAAWYLSIVMPVAPYLIPWANCLGYSSVPSLTGLSFSSEVFTNLLQSAFLVQHDAFLPSYNQLLYLTAVVAFLLRSAWSP